MRMGRHARLKSRKKLRLTVESKQCIRAPVAQLDRASGYEPEGREFESPRAHHSLNLNDLFRVNFTGTVWCANQKVGSSSPPGRAILHSSFQSPGPHSLLKVGRLLGCIGCNNA